MNLRLIRTLAKDRAPADARAEQTAATNGRDGGRGPRDLGYHVPQLVITRGLGAGHAQAVSTHCVIGRAAGSDVIVQDRSISRRHARIALEGEVYVIHDLGSNNGMIVNGRRVRAATLDDGDVIQLGRVEFQFHLREIGAGAASTRTGTDTPMTAGSSVVAPRRRRWVS